MNHLLHPGSINSTNHDWYNCHFHVPWFFQFPIKVEVLILLFTFFQSYSVVSRNIKVHNFANSLFFFVDKVWSSGRDYVICSYVKIPKEFLCFILQDRCWVVPIPFVRMVKYSNLNFLHNFQWITFPTQSCLLLYSFCANLLHSVIM